MTDFYSKSWKDHVPWVVAGFLAVVAVAVIVFGGSRLLGEGSDDASGESEESLGDDASEEDGLGGHESGEGPHDLVDLFVGKEGDGLEEAGNVAVEFAAEATSLEHEASVSDYHDRVSGYTDDDLTNLIPVEPTLDELYEDLMSWEADLSGAAQIYRLQVDGTGKVDVSVHMHASSAEDEYDLGPMNISMASGEQGSWEVSSIYRPVH